MVVTPFAHLTNDELLLESSSNANPTDLEIELALRLELLMQHVDEEVTPARLQPDLL